MEEPTRGQKAARTLGREHMAKIGSRGGKHAPGNFAVKRGLAKRAGIRSGMARRLKKLAIEIDTLEKQEQPQRDVIQSLRAQYTKLQAELEGGHAVDMGADAVAYEATERK